MMTGRSRQPTPLPTTQHQQMPFHAASKSRSTSAAAPQNVRQAQQPNVRRDLDAHAHAHAHAHAQSPLSLSLPLHHYEYPIRARRPGHDPLAEGIAAIGSDLGPTLLPMLQQAMPRDPENIGLPNCRGVKGMNGVMIQVAPVQNIELNNIPSAFDMQSPTYPQQHQFIQSPAFIQSSVSNLSSPVDDRKPSPPHIIQTLPTPAPSISGKKPDDKFKTEFRFVVNEDAKTARNTVRQHVMREFRRRERWEQGRNKVSKSKKSSKKDSNVVIKTEPDSPTAFRPDSYETQAPVPPASLQIVPSMPVQSQRNHSHNAEQHSRRNSGSMSISDSSDASGSDIDKFSAMINQGGDVVINRRRAIQPFVQYTDKGINMHPHHVEEAVEEIERQELIHLPYQQDPWAEIARASINPFSTHLDIGAGAASRSLLHHYAWVMPSLMDEIVTGTVFHRIGWLYSSVANQDPTPFHTIVGFTLGHIAMLRGMDEPPRAIEHKEKSLQLIHRRLADPTQAASDATIGAIANIAAYELVDCNAERFAMHMQGLARLVTQRGGMSDSTFNNPELVTVLVRLDTIRAYMTISQPRFPSWAALRNLPPLAINIGPVGADWFCPPAGYSLYQYLFCEDAIRLIHGLEDVLMLMRSLSPSIPFTPDPSFRILLVESLVNHLRRNIFDCPSEFSNHISRRVIRMAAIVLIDIASAEFFQPRSAPLSPISQDSDRQSKARSPPAKNLPTGNLNSDQPERSPGTARAPADKKGLGLARLRERFPSIEENRHTWGRSVEMIVAVLLQAERMALERPFRAWYVADIVTLTMKLGEDAWRAVEVALMNDIKNRVSEERMARQTRYNMQHNGMGSGMDDVPTWEMDQAVRQFWNEWK